MIKATTSHGTYYFIDEENRLAMRVKAKGRGVMAGDSQWFHYAEAYAFDWDTKKKVEGGIQVGKAINFNLINHSHYDWRISTPVVSIEDYNEI